MKISPLLEFNAALGIAGVVPSLPARIPPRSRSWLLPLARAMCPKPTELVLSLRVLWLWPWFECPAYTAASGGLLVRAGAYPSFRDIPSEAAGGG